MKSYRSNTFDVLPVKRQLRRQAKSIDVNQKVVFVNTESLNIGDWVWLSHPYETGLPSVVTEIQASKSWFTVRTIKGEEHTIVGTKNRKLTTAQVDLMKCSGDVNDIVLLPIPMSVSGFVDRKGYEYSILHMIRERYGKGRIFTNADTSLLMIVNPRRILTRMYTPKKMEFYQRMRYRSRVVENDVPHVYGTAQRAYQNMLETCKDQAIVIMGEHGSGKSETSKSVVQFLCESGSPSTFKSNALRSSMKDGKYKVASVQKLEQQILHVNNVFEAFGNARTMYNKTSSRFARLLSFDFDKRGIVMGATVRAQFLEISRVAMSRNMKARKRYNFDIFYFLMAAVMQDAQLANAFHIDGNQKFKYMYNMEHRSTSPSKKKAMFGIVKLDNVSAQRTQRIAYSAVAKTKKFQQLQRSFSVLNISKDAQLNVFKCLAAILHLGNVKFTHGEQVCSVENVETLQTVADLLDIEYEILAHYFLARKLADGSVHLVATTEQAERSRDVLSRTLYAQIFIWIVEEMNRALGHQFDRLENSNISLHTSGVHVLDIFGFENFVDASSHNLDTLCMNYWNEKMRILYLKYEFELSTLDKSSTDSVCIALNDSMPLLTSFESSQNGMFPVLDQLTRQRTKHDSEWVHILQQSGNKKIQYSPHLNDLTFIVEHFRGNVEYSADGCLRKNREIFSPDVARVLTSSSNKFVLGLGFEGDVDGYSERMSSTSIRSSTKLSSGGRGYGKTLCAQFHSQISALSDALIGMDLHHVLCMNPTSLSSTQGIIPGEFDSDYVLHQLQSYNVSEVMQQRISGYPIHTTRSQFFARYGKICGHRGNFESLARSLTAIGILIDSAWKLMDDNLIAMQLLQRDKLEKARQLFIDNCATVIQSIVRRKLYVAKFKNMKPKLKNIKVTMRKRMQPQLNDLLEACKKDHKLNELTTIMGAKDLMHSMQNEKQNHVLTKIAANSKVPSAMKFVLATLSRHHDKDSVDQLLKELETIEQQHQLALQVQNVLESPNLSIMVNLVADSTNMPGFQHKVLVALLERLTRENDFFRILEVAIKTKNYADLARLLIYGCESNLCHHVSYKQAIEMYSTIGFEVSSLLKAAEFAISNKTCGGLQTVQTVAKALKCGSETYPVLSRVDALRKNLCIKKPSKTNSAIRNEALLQLDTAILSCNVDAINNAIKCAVGAGVAKWDKKMMKAITFKNLFDDNKLKLSTAWKLLINKDYGKLSAILASNNEIVKSSICSSLHETHLKTILNKKEKLEWMQNAAYDTSISDIKHHLVESTKLGLHVEAQYKYVFDLANKTQRYTSAYKALEASINAVVQFLKISGNNVIQQCFLETFELIQNYYRPIIEDRVETPSAIALLKQARDLVEKMRANLTPNLSCEESQIITKKNKIEAQIVSCSTQGEVLVDGQILRWKGFLGAASILKFRSSDLILESVFLFKCVLGYTKEIISVYPAALASNILQLGFDKPAMIDEIYLQLVKQATCNNIELGRIRTWTLLSICAGSLLPSSFILNSVLAFLSFHTKEDAEPTVKNYATYCLYRLKNPQPQKAYIPSIDEILDFDERAPCLVRIELVDGMQLTTTLPITPSLTAAKVVEICSAFLNLPKDCIQYFGIFYENIPLGQQEYISDYYEMEMLHGRPELDFVFKIRLLSGKSGVKFNCEMYSRLVYLQGVEEVLSENLEILLYETVCKLCAIAMLVDLGPHAFDALHESGDQIVNEYIPLRWKNARRVLDFVTDISVLVEDMKYISIAKLQETYIKEISNHRLYGSIRFQTRFIKEYGTNSGITLPTEVTIAMNENGIHFLDATNATFKSCDYNDVRSFDGGINQVELKLWDHEFNLEHTLLFSCSYSRELAQLLQDYISL